MSSGAPLGRQPRQDIAAGSSAAAGTKQPRQDAAGVMGPMSADELWPAETLGWADPTALPERVLLHVISLTAGAPPSTRVGRG